MSLRITACLIVKDEEENLTNCLASIRGHVDEIIVVDTGSTDRTREVAIRHGASVYQFDHRNHPEAFFFDSAEECAKFGAPPPYSNTWALGDFAAARNESFKHATGDFIVWIDADDVIEHAEQFRVAVAEMVKINAAMAFLPYNYAQDHLGRVFYRQWRERIIKKGVAHWLNPVHEVLMPLAPLGPTPRFETPLYQHRRKATRAGIDNRNYKILLRQVMQLKQANPSALLDPRILFYLGQEARFVEPRKAIGFYEEYLQRSGWPEERAAAHSAVGMLLELGALGLPPEQALAQAEREYATAFAEMPENPDGLHGLGRVAYMRKRWTDCIRYIEGAFKIGNTDTMLGTNPMDRTYRPHVYYNYALGQVGRLDEALASCKAALSVMPDDPGVPGGASGMVTLNAGIYQNAITERERAKTAPKSGAKEPLLFDLKEDVDAPPHAGVNAQAVLIWGMQIWKQHMAAGDFARARLFLEAMPSTVIAHPVMQRMFASTNRKLTERDGLTVMPKAQPPRTERLQVVIWTGPAPEPWDPKTPNQKGLGGSETAAIEMAKNLVACGHEVKVYAECSGWFDGVDYRHHSTFTGAQCDVFIASRAPWAVDQFGPVDAKLKLLWVHDIHCGELSAQMERWLYKFDRVLCLSEWHRAFFCQTYPTVHADRVVVTRNGIDPARFTDETPKRNRMVFSSSPNRGLLPLLHNFQEIRRRVPDAELDIFYGFDTWETMARARGAQAELEEIARYRTAIDQAVRAGGVHWHGKRPQTDLAAAFAEAKVWGYLTGFPETSCISAMEAMAAGAVPVCSRFAALGETVKHGILIDSDENAARRFVDECVRMMTDEAARAPIARAAREYALGNLSWLALAQDWSAMFAALIKDAYDNPIPMWRSAS